MTRPKPLSPEAAALEIGITAAQVRKLANRGIIKGRAPTDWRLDPDSVRAYAERERKPGPKPRREA
jgi:hypothetical protein